MIEISTSMCWVILMTKLGLILSYLFPDLALLVRWKRQWHTSNSKKEYVLSGLHRLLYTEKVWILLAPSLTGKGDSREATAEHRKVNLTEQIQVLKEKLHFKGKSNRMFSWLWSRQRETSLDHKRTSIHWNILKLK